MLKFSKFQILYVHTHTHIHEPFYDLKEETIDFDYLSIVHKMLLKVTFLGESMNGVNEAKAKFNKK